MRARRAIHAVGLLVAWAAVNTGASTGTLAQSGEPALPQGLAGGTAAEEPSLPAGLGASADEEPALPGGLDDEDPSLPAGLGSSADEEPALPGGLTAPAGESDDTVIAEEDDGFGNETFKLNGFLEGRFGGRLREDAYERDLTLAETRLQLEAEFFTEKAVFHLTGDFVQDVLEDRRTFKPETGHGFFDLREANAVFSPAAFLDIKAGRQILTWGTGDLLFINDLFPKDWVSFFSGRDEEYLKAPSDALKASVFMSWANLDIVYAPRFDSDRFQNGQRISFYNGTLGRLAGRDAVINAPRPNDWFNDDEWSARLYRNFAAMEAALYAYNGYWKSPAGQNPAAGTALFPRLSVFGASLRGPFWKGIGSAEVGYYASHDDMAGDDPFIRNSEARILLGYEQELVRNLTLGVQYYLEHMMDYGAYRRSLPAGSVPADENHHILTARLTWLTHNQNVTWSLFTFYSPSDTDGYLRPKVSYKVNDNVTVEAGGNLFLGRAETTFFGQLRDNSNIYISLRYGF